MWSKLVNTYNQAKSVYDYLKSIIKTTIESVKEKASVVYDFLSTTIKAIIDTIKEVVENIQKMMEEVYTLLTDPARFGEFLLKAIEKIW